MGILKDLLYNKDNEALDIARLSAFLSVFAYLGMSIYFIVVKDIVDFDFFEWAGGWAALCGGNAAWIYARQRIEVGMEYTPVNPRQTSNNDYGYGGYSGYGGYNYNEQDNTGNR